MVPPSPNADQSKIAAIIASPASVGDIQSVRQEGDEMIYLGGMRQPRRGVLQEALEGEKMFSSMDCKDTVYVSL